MAAVVASALPSSAAYGVLALLEEPDTELQVFALRKLDSIIDETWSEAAAKVKDIEELSDDAAFPQQELAARVASKIMYHLEAYEDALRLALKSGDLFDIEERSEYTEKMIGQCIDEYSQNRVAAAKDPSVPAPPARMEAIVMRMFERCFRDGAWDQAVGVAIEARRLDVVEDAISRAGSGSPQSRNILASVYDSALKFVTTREYRTSIFELLKKLHQAQTPIDYLGLTRCLEALGDAASTADILVQLLKAGAAEEEAETSVSGAAAAAASAAGEASVPSSVRGTTEEAHLMALQIAFDMADSDNQKFLAEVGSSLPKAGSSADERAAAIAVASAAAISGDGPTYGELPVPSNSFWERLAAVHEVLHRDVSLRLQIHFLFKACNADRAILKKLRTAQSRARYDPVAHHALVASAALMHAGTTLDFFYRDNIQWIRQATNWARFSAIASVGVYHKGNVENAMRVLKPMLPNPAEHTQSTSVAGGSLYALGLIHANRGAIEGDEALPFLVNHLSHHDEIVRHGACLGVGLAAMGSCNELAFTEMTNVLFQPSAIGQEAAGLGMGLMLVGNGTSFSSPLTDGMPVVLWLLMRATSTQHEKAVRGITMGIAMSCFGLEEAADVIIEQMSRDGDPIVRYGAQFTRALAYCGSADSRIVRDLLHAAVSDVSDDVRRASVMALGFVLHRKPQDLPHLVGLLAESFNPHVRYGAAMALGIAAAATGMPSALHILKPLLDDPTDFVRQGAFMATAMVLQEESEARTPMVKSFRERVMADACDKYKPPMARMGAIMAAGILDAGGRNCVVSLTTPAGFTKPTAVIGMALFTQYWYWFPLVHCLSLATNPTALVAVAPVKGKPGEFRLPASFGLDCRCKPALFAYPDMISDKPEEKKATTKKVELSTASRSKARSRQRQLLRLRSQRSDGSKISRGASRRTAATTGAAAAGSSLSSSSSSSGVAGAATAHSGAVSPLSPSGSASTSLGASATATPPDATRFMVANASRVAPPQRKFLRVPETARWVPVRKDVTATMGILVVGDSEHRSGSAAVDETDGDLEEIKRPRIGEDAKEPAAPAAFTFTPSDTEWADAALTAEPAAT